MSRPNVFLTCQRWKIVVDVLLDGVGMNDDGGIVMKMTGHRLEKLELELVILWILHLSLTTPSGEVWLLIQMHRPLQTISYLLSMTILLW